MENYTKERVTAAYEAAYSEFDFLIKLFGHGDGTNLIEGRKLMTDYGLDLSMLEAKFHKYRTAQHRHLFSATQTDALCVLSE